MLVSVILRFLLYFWWVYQSFILLLSICLITGQAFAQLEMKGKDPKKNKGQLKAPTQCTAEGFIYRNERILSSNPDFLNTPLGERVNEKPLRTWSYAIGLQTGLGRWLRFDSGLQFIQNGESYAFSDGSSDSTFNYENRYRYLGMPLSINFHWGNSIKLFAGPGITPMIFSQFYQKTAWTTALGSKKDEKLKEKNNEYAASGLQVFGQVGLQWIGKKGWGGMVKIMYRNQITNTFSKYNESIHRAYGWGFGFGITKKLG